MSKKCEKCGKWLKNIRGYNVHYNRMHGKRQEASINIPRMEEILNRVRKLELDNNFMKHQLKHKTFVRISKDSEIDWDIPKEVKEIRNKYKIEFNVIIKELRVVFGKEEFDYHDILEPIEPRNEPIFYESPQLAIV